MLKQILIWNSLGFFKTDMQILAKFHTAKGEFERSEWDLVPLISTKKKLTLKNNYS